MQTPGHSFRTPVWLRVLCVFAAIAFSLASYYLYTTEGWSWLTIGCGVLAVVAVAGAFDAFMTRVELYPERMVVVANLRRREYSRSAFTGVSWAKGVPVTLQLRSGAVLKLPEVGRSTQGVCNSIRAWLKKPVDSSGAEISS
jgi:hypothetical protein